MSVMTGWAATSEKIDLVAAAFVAAAGNLQDIAKDQTADAGSYTYRYADLAAATGMARPVLAGHGLIVTQTPSSDGREVSVATTILHESGQWLAYPPLTMPGGNTPQQAGSAISYARRYALMAILGLATEDDDGARASRPSVEPPRPATISQPNIDRFNEAAETEGASAEDIDMIVLKATDGRTSTLKEVFTSEVATLRDVFKTWAASPLAAQGSVEDPEAGGVTPTENEPSTPAPPEPAGIGERGDPPASEVDTKDSGPAGASHGGSEEQVQDAPGLGGGQQSSSSGVAPNPALSENERTLSDPQMKQLRALYRELGETSAAAQKRLTGVILDTEVSSHAALTFGQAQQLIRRLVLLADGSWEIVLDELGNPVGTRAVEIPG